VVAVFHTASVTVVAIALVLLGRTAAVRGELPPAAAIGPWLTLIAGVVVVGVGGSLLVRHLRRRRAAAARPVAHGPAADPAAHHHGTLPPEVSPLSRRGLVLLAASGGLLPSPSAFLVLSTGLFTGRAAFALVLVAAFSVGLAATIAALGVAVVTGRERFAGRLEARGSRARAALAALPLLSAALIVVLGVVLVVRGALQLT
jgi:ABC-type nickel/cobalt efflux system permease component RcnA